MRKTMIVNSITVFSDNCPDDSSPYSEHIAEVICNKLQPKEIDELIKVLQDDSIKITM